MFKKSDIKKMAIKLNVNLQIITIDTLKSGIKIELEHGYENKKTNITNNDLELTMKIVLAHLIEYPDYYDELEKMENILKQKWKGKKNLIFSYKIYNIFL